MRTENVLFVDHVAMQFTMENTKHLMQFAIGSCFMQGTLNSCSKLCLHRTVIEQDTPVRGIETLYIPTGEHHESFGRLHQ